MSDTPRTDEFIAESCALPPVPIRLWPDFARQLERELNAANAHIKRLEEAAQRVDDAAHSIQDWSGTVLGDALDELNNAKEDKGGGIASREQLPYMSDEQFNRFASIYRSKEDGIQVVGFLHAKVYENNPDWEHLATLDSFRWIQCLLNNSPRERNKQIKEITG